jgi:hypothetical protein
MATRIAVAAEYQRANSRRVILHRSECRFRHRTDVWPAPMDVCLERSTPQVGQRNSKAAEAWVIRKTYRGDQLSQFYLMGGVA